jgi:LuxR family quorum sensing-dependent transcriptional regulator
MATPLAKPSRKNMNQPPVNLTPRARDILQWMADGKSDWEIGIILNVSQHFVDKTARQLRAKLNATNRAQSVSIALRHNPIPYIKVRTRILRPRVS